MAGDVPVAQYTPEGGWPVPATAMTAGDVHRLMSDINGASHAAMWLGHGQTAKTTAKPLAGMVDRTVTDQRGLVVTFHVVFDAYQAATDRSSWRPVDDHTRRYLESLAANGYELCRVEHRACGHDVATKEDAVP